MSKILEKYWFMYEPNVSIQYWITDITLVKFKWKIYRIIAEFSSLENFKNFSENMNIDWVLKIKFLKNIKSNKYRVIKIIENIE